MARLIPRLSDMSEARRYARSLRRDGDSWDDVRRGIDDWFVAAYGRPSDVPWTEQRDPFVAAARVAYFEGST